MTRSEAPVVRKQVVVSAPLEQAFTAFTARFGDFKPPEHNLLAAAITETVFEPRVGGHIYDRAVDGAECRIVVQLEHLVAAAAGDTTSIGGAPSPVYAAATLS